MHTFWGITGAVFSKKNICSTMLLRNHNLDHEALEQNMFYALVKMFIENTKFSEYKQKALSY